MKNLRESNTVVSVSHGGIFCRTVVYENEMNIELYDIKSMVEKDRFIILFFLLLATSTLSLINEVPKW